MVADVEWAWVDDVEQLQEHCRRWAQQTLLAVDTEFMRQRQFYPQLSLVQIYDGQQVVLIDVLAIDQWQPLVEIFQAPQIVKVLHACSEDVEACYHHFGCQFTNLLDTQIAAAMLGYGASMSYQKLVASVLDQHIDKQASCSDWLERPLSHEQLHYAALDVFYLYSVAQQFQPRLQSEARAAWVAEDSARLANPQRLQADPLAYFEQFKQAWRLDRAALATLRELVLWRESSARELDLARSFVISDAHLLLIAQERPHTVAALADMGLLKPSQVRKFAAEVVAAIEVAASLPSEQWPDRRSKPRPDPQVQAVLQRLRPQTAQLAQRLAVAPEVLASRRVLEKAIEHYLPQREAALPEPLKGWRGPQLLPLITAAVAEQD